MIAPAFSRALARSLLSAVNWLPTMVRGAVEIEVVVRGRVAADSDAFAQATVRDYWRLLVGHDPLPAERDEFDALWRAFRAEHGYSVERMLHDLVRTEAYGAP